jgi:hypothetical protein
MSTPNPFLEPSRWKWLDWATKPWAQVIAALICGMILGALLF